MPFSVQHNGTTVKISLRDMLKSSRQLQEERDAIACKRAAIAEKSKLIASILQPAKQEVANVGPSEAAEPAQEGQDHGSNPNAQTMPPNQAIVFGPPQTYLPPSQQNATGNNNNQKNYDGDGNNAPWTAEQDAELLRMKLENGTWKGIATALGRHVQDVKNRWGQIKPKDKGHSEGKQREEENSESAKPSNSGETKCVSFVESPRTDKNKKAHSKKAATSPPDPDFTVDELVLLNTLAAKYEEEKWLRISSRFFDKTGKRLTPQEAKQRIERYWG
ncbi:hypothetical protein VTO42DRAFT_2603 [Malbranchea cinnamomea]